MSLSAKIISALLFIYDIHQKKTDWKIPLMAIEGNAKPTRSMYRNFNIASDTIQGVECYTISSKKKSKKDHIIYFHGGAYKCKAMIFHWEFISWLINEIDCVITFVNYPRAPKSSCRNTVDKVVKVYKHYQSQCSDVQLILMGDSSGGGLSLVLAQCMKESVAVRQPDKLVLLSPWLDVSMSTPVPVRMDDLDYMLDVGMLTRDGISYAADYDTTHPHCSPIYGNSDGLCDIALFIGTRDILYLDSMKFRDQLESASTRLQFYAYENMHHDWMLFPIPEAKHARHQIVDFIQSK